MKSITWKRAKRQGVPDRRRGIVVGIDVSKGKLDFGVFTPERRTATFRVSQDRMGFEKMRKILEDLRAGGHDVWAAFEPTGPYSVCLREWLLTTPYRVVQVNPYHVKRTKEVRDNSPLKTDRKDPRVIADLVFQGCYQEIHPLPPIYAELRAASINWNSLSRMRAMLLNQFQGLLAEWFPELSSFFKDPVCKTARAIVRSFPTPSALGRSSLPDFLSMIRKVSRGKVGPEKAEAIFHAARGSIGCRLGEISRYQHMCRLLRHLEEVEAEQKVLRKRLKELLSLLPEAARPLSVPNVGTITVACLLGACGPLSRYGSYEQLEKFIGLNIFEVSSGRFMGSRHISKRGNSLARWALCQAAVGQMKKSGLFAKYAKRQKEKKQAGNKIRVAIARKLLKLLYVLGRSGAEFSLRRFAERKAGHGRLRHQGMRLKVAA